jgi:hypothetical protein
MGAFEGGNVKSFRTMSLIAVTVLAVAAVAVAGPMESAKGTVETVSGNTVIVTGEDGQVWDFEVTPSTKVLVVGASDKTADLEVLGKKREIGQYVQENDRVSVRYWEHDGSLYIKTLRVL